MHTTTVSSATCAGRSQLIRVARSGTDEWYKARRNGISATTVAKASTPAGYAQMLEEMSNPVEIPDNAYMKFGRDMERWIVDSIPAHYAIEHNDWLVARDTPGDEWQLATPDGLTRSNYAIAEVKTTGKDWGNWSAVPIQYRRQVQWQLHVTGAQVCVFAYLLRLDTAEGFQPAWYEPKIIEVERDDKMIAELIEVAQRLQQELIYREEYARG